MSSVQDVYWYYVALFMSWGMSEFCAKCYAAAVAMWNPGCC